MLVKIANREDPDHQGYGILCSKFRLLLGTFNIEDNLFWGYLPVYKGYLSVYFQGNMGYKPHYV